MEYRMTQRSTLARLLATDPSNTALLTQRVLLGVVMFPHGAQKLLGWFGGYGFDGTMKFFTEVMHLPSPVAALVILGESVGAVALIAGIGTRLAAFGMSAIMLGAIFTTHAKVGFFMDWFGNQKAEGFEFHVLALALSVPLMLWGGGRYALDLKWLAALSTVPRSEAVTV
jgi:putative oxidoreductase